MPRTIKEVRRELRAWGNYWRWQEMGQGYAKRSACDKLGEVMTNSDAHLFDDDFDAPEHIRAIDKEIQRLCEQCRRAVRVRYICQGVWTLAGFRERKTYEYWLRLAEMELV
ncbi:hypothetical protein NFHSH190041_20150 [Shewanella sp. NFH-SH190041]|uniref:hypothetical protein n=1 Tax=Shewanella sp. NFH-SH190041 TaxID=2950245 RepID=UPI0021C3B264|nr:hypothetical protein [Shewanella sp. NFH-SH190041]BDM64563.1 hypothetical protein NFHSH190041_20150 [Shewanella sp. NFH-SH190041]